MEKQTFTIPEGCTEISVEQDGDKLIATFGKSSKFEPKDGDVCAMPIGEFSNPLIFFYTHKRGDDAGIGLDTYGKYSYDGIGLYNDEDMLNIRLATPEESKKLFDALEKEGLQWDAENKKVIKMRRKPELNELYYFFDGRGMDSVEWNDDRFDMESYNLGNVFETKDDCLAGIELIKQALINFHNEN